MVTEYKDLLLNECGDIKIDQGDVVLCEGVDAIRQAWLIHIRTFLGEWFLNLNIGVPYIQKLFSKTLTKTEVQRIFYTASMEVPGILRVNTVDVQDIDGATRTVDVSVECVCDGVEGATTFSYQGALLPDACANIPDSDFPLTLSECVIWFDAQDLTALTVSPLELTNKAGEGSAVGEGSGANTPELVGVTALNNKRAIYFDNPNGGSNDEYLRFANTKAVRAGTGAISIFIVCKPEDPSGTPYDRGLVSFSGFDATDYNRERYDVLNVIPDGYRGTLFRPSPLSEIVDGSMEKAGVTDWTASLATLTKETTTPFKDLQCLRITRTGAVGYAEATQNMFTLDKSYRVRGRARGDGVSAPYVTSGTTVIFSGTTSTAWQAFDKTFLQRTASPYALSLAVSGGAAGNYCDYDSVIVENLIIADGNCEHSGVTAWYADNGATLSKSTVAPYEGTRCLRITRAGDWGGAIQVSVLTPGKTYRIKGAARGDGTSYVRVAVSGTGNVFTSTPSTDWQFFDAVMTPVTYGHIYFYKEDSGGSYVELDAIEIEEVAAEDFGSGTEFDPTLLSYIRDASGDVSIYRDGVLLGATTGIAERALDGDGVIGALLAGDDSYTAENFFHGYIGEVLVYDGEIADNDLDNLHTFLLAKWAF